jgi:hypothetical protein
MVPESFHEFFLGSAGVAGGLIGLLFVAVSVAPERVTAAEAERAHQVRARAALTSFGNALAVSLFALIPNIGFGGSVTVIGTIGLLFVAGSLLSLLRTARNHHLRTMDYTFLAGLAVVFGLQLVEGLRLSRHHGSADATSTVAVLVIACFFIGISRAWELIGGPTVSLGYEVTAAVRNRQKHND